MKLILWTSCTFKYLEVLGSQGQDPAPMLLPSLSGFDHLVYLKLNDLHILKLPEDISCLCTLQRLFLRGNDFESIPASIIKLSGLEELDLSYCRRLQSLPQLPEGLSYLHAHECTSLETVSDSQKFFHTGDDGYYIFSNCFRLNEDARSIILENAKVSIEHVLTHVRDVKGRTITCLPGNEVSKWFGYRCTGSSVTIQMAPHSLNDDFRGFAFCITVSFEDYSIKSKDRIRSECHLESQDGDHFDRQCYFDIICTPDGKPKCLGTDHVFFLYDESLFDDGDRDRLSSYDQSSKGLSVLISFKFGFSHERAKVESCGVRALYAQEFNGKDEQLDSMDEGQQGLKRMKKRKMREDEEEGKKEEEESGNREEIPMMKEEEETQLQSKRFKRGHS